MEAMVGANLGIAQAVVATLGTVMMIGLGFLQHPSRSSLLWSLGFMLGMTATWTSLAGEVLGDEITRRVGLGLMLGAPALFWAGFRARRRVRTFAWIAPVQSGVSAIVLVLPGESSWYGLVFRFAFLGAAVFAALVFLEIRRQNEDRQPLVWPFLIASAAFVVIGVTAVLTGIVTPFASTETLAVLRLVNALGMLVYLVCATVSLLFLAAASPSGETRSVTWNQFTVWAGDRLTRARSAGETSWVLLVFRIDDPDDIRGVAGEHAFTRIADRFASAIVANFPAEADIARHAPGRIAVLLSRPGPSIREYVRRALRDITEIDIASQLAIQISGSVGWAPADLIGYDFPALLDAAGTAADEASALGGDRWQRVGA